MERPSVSGAARSYAGRRPPGIAPLLVNAAGNAADIGGGITGIRGNTRSCSRRAKRRAPSQVRQPILSNPCGRFVERVVRQGLGCHRPRCRVFGLSVAFQLTGHREFHPRPRRGALLSRFAKPRPSCSPALTSGRLHGATLGERSGTIIRPAAEGGDCAGVGERRRVPSPRIFAGERPLAPPRPPRHAAGCGFTGTPSTSAGERAIRQMPLRRWASASA